MPYPLHTIPFGPTGHGEGEGERDGDMLIDALEVDVNDALPVADKLLLMDTGGDAEFEGDGL